MIWAVLDTNTVVSGFGWPETIPSRIIDHLLAGRFVVVMKSIAVLVDPKTRISVLADDDDNRLLEAASEAHADYIVSGDKALQELEIFEGCQMMTPKAFLAILEGPHEFES